MTLRSAIAYARRPDIQRDMPRLLLRRAWYGIAPHLPGDRLARRQVVRFDGDLRMRVDPLDEVGRAIYKYGVYEHFNVDLFRALLAPGIVVLDAGANIGQYTLLAAKATRPGGRVLAFEPEPDTFAELRHNVLTNGFSNVELFQMALGSRSCDVQLFRSPQEHNAGLASLRPPVAHPSIAVRGVDAPVAATVTVRCSPLDDVLAERGVESLDVVKLDVEGFEHEILAGADRSIAAFRPAILFEVNDIEERLGSFTAPSLEWLRERGYRLFGVRTSGHGGRRLEELPPGEDPRPFKEAWQMCPELTEDPSPDISPNLLALHPASSHWARHAPRAAHRDAAR